MTAVRKVAAVTAAVLALLSGCSKKIDAGEYDMIKNVCSESKEQTKAKVEFVMQISFGSENTSLLFNQGEYVKSSENGMVMSGSTIQTVLGIPASVKFDYDRGNYYVKNDKKIEKKEIPESEMKKGFAFSDVYCFDVEDVKSITKNTVSAGENYEVEIKDEAKNLTAYALETVGEDIYALCRFEKPIKEKTFAKDMKINYTVSNGKLAARSLSFTLRVYDSPPYVPGKKPDYEAYSLDLQVMMRMSIDNENVKMPPLDVKNEYEGAGK